jgi:hypothetical protein
MRAGLTFGRTPGSTGATPVVSIHLDFLPPEGEPSRGDTPAGSPPVAPEKGLT